MVMTLEIRDPQLPAFPSSQTCQHKETYIHNVAQLHRSLRHLTGFRFLYQRYSEVHKTPKIWLNRNGPHDEHVKLLRKPCHCLTPAAKETCSPVYAKSSAKESPNI